MKDQKQKQEFKNKTNKTICSGCSLDCTNCLINTENEVITSYRLTEEKNELKLLELFNDNEKSLKIFYDNIEPADHEYGDLLLFLLNSKNLAALTLNDPEQFYIEFAPHFKDRYQVSEDLALTLAKELGFMNIKSTIQQRKDIQKLKQKKKKLVSMFFDELEKNQEYFENPDASVTIKGITYVLIPESHIKGMSKSVNGFINKIMKIYEKEIDEEMK